MYRLGFSEKRKQLLLTKLEGNDLYTTHWIKHSASEFNGTLNFHKNKNQLLTYYTEYKVTALGTYKTKKEAINDHPEYFL